MLYLRNGDRVSGQLITEEPTQIILSNAVVGRIVVPLSEVDRRVPGSNETAAASAPGPGPVVLPPALERRLNELQASYLANQLSALEYHRQRARILAEATALPATNPPVAQATKPTGVPAPALVNPAVAARPPAVTATPTGPAPVKHWSGEVLMGTDLGFSEKNRELYTGRFKASYTMAPLRHSLDYSFTYGKTDGELSANRMDGFLKSDFDLNRRWYVYNLLGAGYDEIRKINWRYDFGPGLGEHLLKLTNFVFNAEFGFNYQVQNLQDDRLSTNRVQNFQENQPVGTNLTHIIRHNRQEEVLHYRLAQDLKWVIGSQFTFDEKAEYQPEWNDLQAYRMRVEANLRYWLRANFSLNFTIIDTFDTVTAKGVGQNDLQIRSSIGVKF